MNPSQAIRWAKVLCVTLLTMTANAFAARPPVSFSPVQIKNLPSGKNLIVSAFYASGSNPSLAAEGTVPYVRTIMAGPVDAVIHADGTAELPKIDVVRSGFELPNLIVLVVHSANQGVNIRNPDGMMATTQGPVNAGGDDDTSSGITRTVALTVTLNSDHTAIDTVDTVARAVSVTNGSTITVDMAAQ